MDSRTEGWGNWKNGIEAGFSDRAVKRRRAEAARRAGQPPPRSSKSIAGLDYALIPVAIERPGQVGPGRAPKGASGQGLTGWLDYFLVSFSVAFSASNVALSISTLGSVVGRRPRRDVHHRRRRERATTKIHQRNRRKNYTRKPIPECTFKRLPSIVFFFFQTFRDVNSWPSRNPLFASIFDSKHADLWRICFKSTRFSQHHRIRSDSTALLCNHSTQTKQVMRKWSRFRARLEQLSPSRNTQAKTNQLDGFDIKSRRNSLLRNSNQESHSWLASFCQVARKSERHYLRVETDKSCCRSFRSRLRKPRTRSENRIKQVSKEESHDWPKLFKVGPNSIPTFLSPLLPRSAITSRLAAFSLYFG